MKQQHSYSQVLDVVKSCQTWTDFRLNYTPIYDYANSKRWGYSLKVDSGIRHRFYYKWMTNQQLIELASIYSSLTELTKENGALQAELYKRKLTRQLPYEFKGEGNKRLFTYERCKQAVSEVSSRQELFETNPQVYTAIYRYGYKTLFDESYNLYSPANVLYIWNSVQYPNLWKVGVSSDKQALGGTRWQNRIKCVAREGHLTPDRVYHIIVESPSILETQLLSEYPKYEWKVKFDGSTEFLNLSNAESQSIISQYFTNPN